MWQYWSLSRYKFERNRSYFDSILSENSIEVSQATKDIEKDLIRTFPHHPSFKELSSSGIRSMRKVLTAFSWRHPRIGYCQSMVTKFPALFSFFR